MIVVVLQVEGLKDNARSQFRVNQESRVTDEIEHSERLCTGGSLSFIYPFPRWVGRPWSSIQKGTVPFHWTTNDGQRLVVVRGRPHNGESPHAIGRPMTTRGHVT